MPPRGNPAGGFRPSKGTNGKALLDDWNYLRHRPDFRDRECRLRQFEERLKPVADRSYNSLMEMTPVPPGFVDCAQTIIASNCEDYARKYAGSSGFRMVIKLPDGGTVDDLNEFLRAELKNAPNRPNDRR